MGAGVPFQLHPQRQALRSEFVISPDSARTLADAFDDPLVTTVGTLSTIAAFLAAFFAYLALRQNKKTQQQLLVQSVYEQFLNINRDFASKRTGKGEKITTLNQHEKELLANFFERLATLIKQRQIPFEEIENYKTEFVSHHKNFVESYRKTYGKKFYENIDWLVGKLK